MSKKIADLVDLAHSPAATEYYPTPAEKCVRGEPQQSNTTHFEANETFFFGEWGNE